MNQVAVLKELTIGRKPLIECTFKTGTSLSFSFQAPTPTPQKLGSFTMWAENAERERDVPNDNEEREKTD